MPYNHKSIESKWTSKLTSYTMHNDNLHKKYYVLSMLPYPSGKLHMGHIRNYTIGDVIARYKKLQGYDVIHPIGWDSFGMPAENAAIGGGNHPKTWTEQNIAHMRQQLKTMGYMYDWGREISTCSDNYYSQEQKIFLEMYRKGIIYRKKSYVNWDPVDQTVLANEQVIDGKGWRSGAPVEKKLLEQWSVNITAYAEQLLQSLEELKGHWPDNVIKMQENWIGKSVGAMVDFQIKDSDRKIQIYTTRPDTLFGSSFVAISADHDLSKELAADNDKIDAFREECKQIDTTEEAMSKMEKLGIDTGLKAINPITKQEIPVYIANFVLMDYGTGAIFGCPAHDERDHDFATKYGLTITPVIECGHDCSKEPYTEDGPHINSDFLNGLNTAEAKTKAIEWLESNNAGQAKTMYRLRDWLVSRQRYWGCPIPIIHCPHCGMVEAELPVLLPEDVTIDGNGNPLEKSSWSNTKCPKCGSDAKRETDTLDTFFESSWYYLRYLSPYHDYPFEQLVADHCMPVDICIGGVEHAVLHLLYARFFMIVLHELGYISDNKPPFKKLLTQGMVCHKLYRNELGEYVYPDEVARKEDGLFDEQGNRVTELPYEKMSKSKKNVVSPDAMTEKYGVDAMRLFILSDTPPEKNFDWNDDALDGSWRFLNRIYKLCCELGVYGDCNNNDISFGTGDGLIKTAHQYLQRIYDSYDSISLNKTIALCRELFNAIEKDWRGCSKEVVFGALDIFVMSLYPFCPFICSDIWSLLHDGEFVQDSCLIPVDSDLASVNSITIVVQLNGKTKGKFECSVDASEDILRDEAVKLLGIDAASVKRCIVVKGRLVNVVV